MSQIESDTALTRFVMSTIALTLAVASVWALLTLRWARFTLLFRWSYKPFTALRMRCRRSKEKKPPDLEAPAEPQTPGTVEKYLYY
jgi:hypothetical protein